MKFFLSLSLSNSVITLFYRTQWTFAANKVDWALIQYRKQHIDWACNGMAPYTQNTAWKLVLRCKVQCLHSFFRLSFSKYSVHNKSSESFIHKTLCRPVRWFERVQKHNRNCANRFFMSSFRNGNAISLSGRTQCSMLYGLKSVIVLVLSDVSLDMDFLATFLLFRFCLAFFQCLDGFVCQLWKGISRLLNFFANFRTLFELFFEINNYLLVSCDSFQNNSYFFGSSRVKMSYGRLINRKSQRFLMLFSHI